MAINIRPSDCILNYKGYGRIYVKTKEDVRKAEQILETLDEFEFDYMPSKLITPIDDYPRVVWIGKFELHPDFEKVCEERGIQVYIFNAFDNDSPKGVHICIEYDLTLEQMKEQYFNGK